MEREGVAAAAGSSVGRFALARLLKHANGVATYEGIDTADGSSVIVKTVATADLSAAVRLRLEHEADVLERLETRSGRLLVASGYEGPVLYLAQRRLAGRTLQQRLRAGPLAATEAVHLAIDLLEVLHAVHEQGVLHRDVKPANIIVDDDGPAGRAHLIDFGLSRSARLDVSVREDLVGTARYLAPEAAGLVGGGIDERSDLYAVGVVLFEALAGHPPFEGDTVGEVLRQHLNAPPPSLRAAGVAVPRALDGVVQRLLGKDPSARYQSAAAARADLVDLRDALESGVAEPAITLGTHDRRQALTEPAFVGRTDELGALTQRLDEAVVGEGRLVLVEAESGGGKTRLLDELAQHAAQRDVWVLRGQGADRTAQRPFQVLDGVVNGITGARWTEAELLALRDELRPWAGAVTAAAPGLAPVLGEDPTEVPMPEAFGENRSVDALGALLDALGRPDRPVLVLLDDCQWADRLTLSLLAGWHARRQAEGAAPGHVLVVAAFRSEEVPAGHALRAIRPCTTVALAPFSAGDVAALCTSMAGPLPVEALDAIIHLAEGSPFMAAAVLRGMAESGALRGTAEGWEVDPELLRDAQTSRRAALFLARRFELLGADALALLSVGAVLGKEFDLGLAAQLTGQDAATVTPALDDARRRRILWIDEAESRCSFTHDKLRETLLGRLGVDERIALHRRAGEEIEATDASRIFELAYHFDEAGELERALPYALEVAQVARQRHALDVRVTHYRIAQRAAERNGDAALRCRVAQGLGDVLTLKGSYAEAAEVLEVALDLATDAETRAELDWKLGDVAFKRGDQLQARLHLERALRDLGRWVPGHALARLTAAVFEVGVQLLHTVAPRLFLGRRSPDGAERELLAINIYSRLAYVYWFSAGKVPCAWAHLREMNLAERYPPSLQLAQAYSEHAPVMSMVPWYGRGIAYATRSYEIRRDLGDVWGQAQSLNFTGVVLYAASRYEESIERSQEAIRLLERTGDRWEQNTATWTMVFSYYRLGRLDVVVDLARQLYASASAIGDLTAAGEVLSAWARAAEGRVPAEHLAVELARDTGDAQTSTEVHLADAIRLLYGGEVDAAVARMEEAAAIVAKAGLRQEYVAPVQPWLATALRMQLEAMPAHAPRALRRRRLRRAARVARQADRLSRSYRNNRPHALRERALILSLAGRSAKAERLLARSLAVAEGQGAAHEVVLTQLAAAQLAVAAGRHGAGRDLAEAVEAKAAFDAQVRAVEDPAADGAPETLSLADRFDSLLEAGRRIGSATSGAAVYAAVREAASLLLRGDRCHVIELEDDLSGILTTESGENVQELSRRVLAEAIERRSPVIAGPASDADSSESLLLAGLRSVLCAPVVCDGRVVACFYVTHHEVDDLFGDTEVQLAEFIATVAGAALEQVAGSEARFRSLVHNSSDVITIVDRSGRVIYQSSSVERVFGYQLQEVVGRDLRSWLHRSESAALLAVLGPDAEVPEGSTVVETRVRHRDGTYRDVETTVTNLLDNPQVRGLVLNSRDVSERVALESELRTRAWHDPLTGLPNRALFLDRVDHALARRARSSRPLAVAFLDLDDFKSLNDTMGHAAGDELLCRMAARLGSCVRPGDTVARFAGDEFALLLDDADAVTADVVASRIIDELRRPFVINGQEVYARASIGLAFGYGPESSDDLLSAADTAMYVAKGRGKSRFEVFEPSMRDVAVARAGLRSDLEVAVRRGELEIHYQPVVDVTTGRARGFEALLRWNHPTRGLLGPDEFIELAEQSGHILAIGGWVLDHACRQAAQWRREPDGAALTVSVNVSARQLQDPGLVAGIMAALEASRLDPGSLVLEITESATVSDTEGVIARLEELKGLGVGLAIDDFGTGYSSLSYLRRFPVDLLKVDRSFVSGVATNEEDRAIVASVIDLAHAFGIRVVAEGVETREQLAALGAMGCDLAQGFNWRRPADARSIDEWLASDQLVTDGAA